LQLRGYLTKTKYWGNIQHKEEHKINSVSSLVEILKKHELDKGEKASLFFRGESKDHKETKLMPGVFYEKTETEESFYYYDALTNFPQEFENLSTLSRLAKMQHYGYRTRLLDLTSNPLVALWFACRKDMDEDAYFYILKTKEVLNYDSDKALLLSCFSHFNNEQQKSIKEFVDEFMKSGDSKYNGCITNRYVDGKLKKKTVRSNENGCFQFARFIGEVARERPAFASYRTVATDLYKRFVVKPLVQNERQKSQGGSFLLFGLLDDSASADKESTHIEVFSYKVKGGKEKDNIIKELDLLGINKATIFCDVGSRANYINEKQQARKENTKT